MSKITKTALTLLITFALFSATFSVAMADQPYGATGYVYDSVTHAAINGATISSNFGLSGSTDSSGYFTIGGSYNLVDGQTYQITASAANHQSAPHSFTYQTGDGGQLNLRFDLQPIYPTTTVRGSVKYNHNPAPDGVSVKVGNGNPVSSVNGNYAIPGVAGGITVAVSATYSDGHIESSVITTSTTGSDTTVDFDYVPQPSAINGVVKYNGVQISSGSAVVVLKLGSTTVDTKTTDSTGSFSFTGLLPATTYSLSATYTATGISATGSRTANTPMGGSTITADIDTSSGPGGVSGTVTCTAGSISENIAGIVVTAGSSSTTTDASGYYSIGGLTGGSSVSVSATYHGHTDSLGVTVPGDGTTKTGVNLNIACTQSTVQFQDTTSSVNEGSSVNVNLVRSGDLPSSFSVTVSGNPSSGYTISPTTVSFGASDTSKSFSVSVPSDNTAQGNRQVTLSLSSPTNSAGLGSQTTNTLTIYDANAAPTIEFLTSIGSATVGGSDAVVTVHRYGATSGVSSVRVALNGGTAIYGVDYTTNPSLPYTINFAAGETDKTFSVHANQATGNAVFQLDTVSGAALGGKTLYTTNLLSNNGPVNSGATFQFASPGSTALSGDVTVTVTRNGDTGSTNTVEVWVGGSSTALAGTDFSAKPQLPATLSFGPGETQKTVTISILKTPDNGTKTVALILSNPSSGATIGYQNTYVLTIGKVAIVATPAASAGNATATPTPTPTPTASPTPVPTSTENTGTNWAWLLLLMLIPLAGVVIYYFAFVREK